MSGPLTSSVGMFTKIKLKQGSYECNYYCVTTNAKTVSIYVAVI